MAEVALDKRGGEDNAFDEAKLATARFYMQRVLPRHSALFATAMAGQGDAHGFSRRSVLTAGEEWVSVVSP